MANPLNRNLKDGDKLVMQNGAVVEVHGEMFGSKSFTSGTALGVLHNGCPTRCDSYDIDADKTLARFADVNGWNVPATAEPAKS